MLGLMIVVAVLHGVHLGLAYRKRRRAQQEQDLVRSFLQAEADSFFLGQMTWPRPIWCGDSLVSARSPFEVITLSGTPESRDSVTVKFMSLSITTEANSLYSALRWAVYLMSQTLGVQAYAVFDEYLRAIDPKKNKE